MRFAVLLFSWGISAAAVAAGPRVVPGETEAWRFPAGYEPRPLSYSGIYQMDGRRQPPMLPHLGRTLTWRSLNPRDGVYDFSYLEKELRDAERGGYMVIFRLKASIVRADPPEVGQDGRQSATIPDWVVEKYHLAPDLLFLTSDPAFHRGDSYKQYAAPWHPGVQAEFHRFLIEFGRRGFLESNHLAAVYLHGMSISSGEEFDLRNNHYSANADAAARAAGFTGAQHGNPLADAIMDCWSQRMQWWREAAGDRVYKIAFVGSGNMPGFPYPQEQLVATALREGLGQRYGNLEEYYYGNVTPPKHGQRYLAPGYVEIDWQHPLRDGRYWGDEIEEMNHYKLPRGAEPSADVRALCYRSAFFRAAQLGMNFLWTNVQFIDAAGTADGVADDRDYLPKWFTQVAGKSPEFSPDAAAWLRLAYVRVLPGARGVNDAQPWHNLERLLLQRDLPARDGVTGAMSQPALPLDFPYVALKLRDAPDGPPETSDNEYTARRTDLATGNPHLAFKLDPAFRRSLHEQAQPVEIRVHYRHDGVAPFTVRVARRTPPYFADLGTVANASPDGAWKTAIFTIAADQLPEPSPDSGLGPEIDFAVRALGTGATQDLTVRYVRVVRTAEIAAAPFIKAPPRSKSVAAGETVRLAVHAEGPGELRYAWFKDDQPIRGSDHVSGADRDTLVLRQATAADAGAYTVEIANEIRGTRRAVRATAAVTVP